MAELGDPIRVIEVQPDFDPLPLVPEFDPAPEREPVDVPAEAAR